MSKILHMSVGLVLFFLVSTQGNTSTPNFTLSDRDISTGEKAALLLGPNGKVIQRQLLQESLVLVHNANDQLPLDVTAKYAIVVPNTQHFSEFRSFFGRFASYDLLPWKGKTTMDRLEEGGKNYKAIILLVDNQGVPAVIDNYNWWKSFQINKPSAPLVLVHFGDPYHLADIDQSFSILQSPSHSRVAEELGAQALFGALNLEGKLPYKINDLFPDGSGSQMPASRMAYGIPEEVNIAAEKLVGVDAIIKSAIARKAMPGCQVVVAKAGKIIYSKAFGHHTYDQKREIHKKDLYDLASVTKVAGTTLATMKLYDEEKISIEGRVGEYWPIEGYSSLKRISLRRLLAHQSGLQSYLPIASYLKPLSALDKNGKPIYSKAQKEDYAVAVTNAMYMSKDANTAYLNRWHRLPIARYRKYRYSDVNFAVLKELVESVIQEDISTFLEREFYQSMGLRSMVYRPYDRFSLNNIAPTIKDHRWRKSLIHGYVHDEGAAMQGGIAGHAGLFGNAEDLSKLFQLFLNKGFYGNRQYLKGSTVSTFIASNKLNHRALGFDRTKVKHKKGTNTVFGHTGFTGTCVWADPETDLVYVFLSNRIHPNPKNNKLSELQVRERILKEIYNAMDTYDPSKEKVSDPTLRG